MARRPSKTDDAKAPEAPQEGPRGATGPAEAPQMRRLALNVVPPPVQAVNAGEVGGWGVTVASLDAAGKALHEWRGAYPVPRRLQPVEAEAEVHPAAVSLLVVAEAVGAREDRRYVPLRATFAVPLDGLRFGRPRRGTVTEPPIVLPPVSHVVPVGFVGEDPAPAEAAPDGEAPAPPILRLGDRVEVPGHVGEVADITEGADGSPEVHVRHDDGGVAPYAPGDVRKIEADPVGV